MKFQIAGLAREKVLSEIKFVMEKHFNLFCRQQSLSLLYYRRGNRELALSLYHASERNFKRFDNAREIKATLERGCN